MREHSEEPQGSHATGGPARRDDEHGEIIEAIGHAIVVVDGLHRIRACNRRFLDMFELDVGAWSRVPLADAVNDDRLEDAIASRIATGEESRELEYYRTGGDEGVTSCCPSPK